MKKKVRKDVYIRKNYLNSENSKFMLSYSTHNFLFLASIRENLSQQAQLIPLNSSIFRSIFRCVLSGRRKRLNSWFSFSRLRLLKLYRSGLLFSLQKLK